MKRPLWLLLVLSAFSLGAQGLPPPTSAVTIDPPNANGVCAVHGTLQPGESVALLCTLGHAEGTTLLAMVETGALDVQGAVLRVDQGTALVALHNAGIAPADLYVTRVSLLRAVPATPFPAPRSTYERCLRTALSQGDDGRACDLWKSEEGTTPAAATAGAE